MGTMAFGHAVASATVEACLADGLNGGSSTKPWSRICMPHQGVPGEYGVCSGIPSLQHVVSRLDYLRLAGWINSMPSRNIAAERNCIRAWAHCVMVKPSCIWLKQCMISRLLFPAERLDRFSSGHAEYVTVHCQDVTRLWWGSVCSRVAYQGVENSRSSKSSLGRCGVTNGMTTESRTSPQMNDNRQTMGLGVEPVDGTSR